MVAVAVPEIKGACALAGPRKKSTGPVGFPWPVTFAVTATALLTGMLIALVETVVVVVNGADGPPEPPPLPPEPLPLPVPVAPEPDPPPQPSIKLNMHAAMKAALGTKSRTRRPDHSSSATAAKPVSAPTANQSGLEGRVFVP
jgi:hypothetical protein